MGRQRFVAEVLARLPAIRPLLPGDPVFTAARALVREVLGHRRPDRVLRIGI
jgi:hypothetical protein